jgi:hypothetical protein
VHREREWLCSSGAHRLRRPRQHGGAHALGSGARGIQTGSGRCRAGCSDAFAAQASCETPATLAELGAQGIAPHLRADSVVIDMSVASPIDTRATAAALKERGIELAVELAHSRQAPAQLHELCSELWYQASERLGARSDNTEIARYLEGLSAVHGAQR